MKLAEMKDIVDHYTRVVEKTLNKKDPTNEELTTLDQVQQEAKESLCSELKSLLETMQQLKEAYPQRKALLSLKMKEKKVLPFLKKTERLHRSFLETAKKVISEVVNNGTASTFS
jgi:hypothetical protein